MPAPLCFLSCEYSLTSLSAPGGNVLGNHGRFGSDAGHAAVDSKRGRQPGRPGEGGLRDPEGRRSKRGPEPKLSSGAGCWKPLALYLYFEYTCTEHLFIIVIPILLLLL